MTIPLERASRVRLALAGAVLSVTVFLAVYDGLVVTVALPHIEAEFSISQLDAQWLITAYALSLGGLLLFGGRCGDRFGQRRVLAIGLSGFAAGLLGSGLSHSLWLMLAARMVQGVGAALAIPSSFAIISSLRHTGRRNRLFAAVGLAGSLGAAGGAVIGGVVTQALGWRYVFLLTAPLALLGAGVAPRVVTSPPACDRAPRLGGVAAGLSALGLTSLVFAITSIERVGLTALDTLGSFGLAIVMFALFAMQEARARHRLVPPRLLRTRTLWAAIASMPSQVFAYQGTVFLGLLFLQQVLRYGPFEAGMAFVPLGLSAAAASPAAARLLAIWHWRYVVAAAQLVSTMGLLLLAFASTDARYLTRILPAFILVGAGITIVAVALNMAVGQDVKHRDKGVAYGLFETSTHASGGLVVAVLATVATAVTRASDVSERAAAYALGYRAAFAVAAFAALVGGGLALMLGRRSEARA